MGNSHRKNCDNMQANIDKLIGFNQPKNKSKEEIDSCKDCKRIKSLEEQIKLIRQKDNCNVKNN